MLATPASVPEIRGRFGARTIVASASTSSAMNSGSLKTLSCTCTIAGVTITSSPTMIPAPMPAMLPTSHTITAIDRSAATAPIARAPGIAPKPARSTAAIATG